MEDLGVGRQDDDQRVGPDGRVAGAQRAGSTIGAPVSGWAMTSIGAP